MACSDLQLLLLLYQRNALAPSAHTDVRQGVP